MNSSGTTRYVALLRGINVGGKNKLRMEDLRRVVEQLGGSQVGSYIQSGNVLFNATAKLANAMPAKLEQTIASEFGLEVPVVVRSRSELERTLRDNPFLASGESEEHCHVVFLSSAAKPTAIRKLDPARSPSDQFAVVGSELYLHLPNGVAGTKLSVSYFDRTLEITCTQRNWRTLGKLVSMCQAEPT